MAAPITARTMKRRKADPIVTRDEQVGDEAAIRAVHERAFGQNVEADIVDRLRLACSTRASFVALVDDAIVGHVLLTPAVLELDHRTVAGAGLAPLAVLPEYQNLGIGMRLVARAIKHAAQTGTPFVIVLGHPEYYPRFGFEPASRFGIVCPFLDVPDEAFMILMLKEEALRGVNGIARYHPEFAHAV